jgi:hypothetical protein
MNIEEVSNHLKCVFALPETPVNKEYISLSEYLEIVESKNLKLSTFFINEIRRLFCFRHLMCFKSNYTSNIGVVLYDSSNVSRLDYPISLNEKNYCYNSDDNSCRVPKNVIKEWFDNDIELFYETMKDFVTNLNLEDEFIFKCTLIKHIKKKYRYDNFIVFWLNSMLENLRIYNK